MKKNTLKNLTFIICIILVSILVKFILNYLDIIEHEQENFNPGRYWVRKDNLFKCGDGKYRKRCGNGKYIWEPQASSWSHTHEHLDEIKDIKKGYLENRKNISKQDIDIKANTKNIFYINNQIKNINDFKSQMITFMKGLKNKSNDPWVRENIPNYKYEIRKGPYINIRNSPGTTRKNSQIKTIKQ